MHGRLRGRGRGRLHGRRCGRGHGRGHGRRSSESGQAETRLSLSRIVDRLCRSRPPRRRVSCSGESRGTCCTHCSYRSAGGTVVARQCLAHSSQVKADAANASESCSGRRGPGYSFSDVGWQVRWRRRCSGEHHADAATAHVKRNGAACSAWQAAGGGIKPTAFISQRSRHRQRRRSRQQCEWWRLQRRKRQQGRRSGLVHSRERDGASTGK